MRTMLLSAVAALGLCLAAPNHARAQYVQYSYYPTTAYTYGYYPGYATYYPYTSYYSYPAYNYYYPSHGYYEGYYGRPLLRPWRWGW